MDVGRAGGRRKIVGLTRLDEAITICDGKESAFAGAAS
jgi:hypothetical protein